MKTRILTVVAALALGAGSALAQEHDHSMHSTAPAASMPAATDAAAANEMTAADLKARLDKGEKIVVVDARHNLGGQKLKNAVHVPGDKLAAWAENVDKKTVIVTYCTCPHDEAAIHEMEQLRGMGFAGAYTLKGGMRAAQEAGIELVTATADE